MFQGGGRFVHIDSTGFLRGEGEGGGGVGDENFLSCPEGGRKVPLQAEVSLRTSGIGLGFRISDFVLGRLWVFGI